MMTLKHLTLLRRPHRRAGDLNAIQKAEEGIVTWGWLCMAATLLVALLAAAYAAV